MRAAEIAGAYRDESDGTTPNVELVSRTEVKVTLPMDGENLVLTGRVNGTTGFNASVTTDKEQKFGMKVVAAVNGDRLSVTKTALIDGADVPMGTSFWRRTGAVVATAATTDATKSPAKESPTQKAQADAAAKSASKAPTPTSSRPTERELPTTGELNLGSANQAPGLRLACLVPEGFVAKWLTGERGPNIVRISKTGSADEDHFLISAARVSDKERARSADTYFTPEVIAGLAKSIAARKADRVENGFWNGAYFETYYGRKTPANTTERTGLRVWVRVVDEYAVQFQCHVLQRGDAEEQQEKDEKLLAAFQDLLYSVRVIE